MKQALLNVSLKNKLMAIILLTSGTVLFIVSLAFFVNEAITFRQGLRQELGALADIIAKNTAVALVINDRESASETLEGLSVRPYILGAFIVTNNGGLFADYISSETQEKRLSCSKKGDTSWKGKSCAILCHTAGKIGWKEGEPQPSMEAILKGITEDADFFWDLDGNIDVLKPIIFDGSKLGTVVIQSDLKELFVRLRWFFITVLAIMAGASLVAFFISRRLQGVISGPITRLAGVMKTVSDEKNYAIQATRESDDEIGSLITGFNEMLEQIRARDERLERYNEELEDNVALRTAELRDANANLQRTIDELRKAKEAAEAANTAKSQFLANMSHEIRTPMNGVIGMTELILATDLTERQRKYGESVYASAESLLGVINDILDFSKIEAGRLELEEVPFSLHDKVHETLVLFGLKAKRKGLALKTVFEPNVPEWVQGDPMRLRQILVNLVGNAVKFTGNGEVAVRVSWLDEADERSLVGFEVRDTGMGIPLESRERIFDSFSQADGSTTRKYGGTGLGLTIAKQLVEMMGGGISVESSPGKGSSFRFNVRVRKLIDEGGSGDRSTDESGEIRSLPLLEGGGHRSFILVAEDNPVNQEVCREILEHLGCRVAIVSNGREAFEAVSRNRYDLVFMDFQMPEMDGVEATRRIRARERETGGHTRIVALTARAMEGDREQCLLEGMDDYLSKPFTMESMRAILERWLQAVPGEKAEQGEGGDEAAPRAPSSRSPELSPERASHIDKNTLDAIRTLDNQGKGHVLRKVTEMFLTHTPQLMVTLRDVVVRADATGVEKTAHSLKSSCAMVGAHRLSKLCGEMEQRGRHLSLKNLAGLLRDIEAEFEEVKSTLTAEAGLSFTLRR